MTEIRHPFGAADAQSPAHATTQAVTITDQFTVLNPGEATGNVTLNLTLSSELIAGALLLVKLKTNGSETFTFGTGITAPVVTGVAGKTWSQLFVYDGSGFVPAGVHLQND